MRSRPLPQPTPGAYVVSFSDEARGAAFGVAQDLRGAGLSAELDLAGRSPKGQLKQAGRSAAKFALLLGLDEFDAAHVRVKTMDGGGEEDLAAAGLAAHLAARLAKEA